MVTINQLASMVINISGKNISIQNIEGNKFVEKYGFNYPLGVKGRNSDNKLYKEKVGWVVNQPLSVGIQKTYKWILEQVKNNKWIYESPVKGETIYHREIFQTKKEKIK
jgi:GDP-D-mannose 3', 5'-epimerase